MRNTLEMLKNFKSERFLTTTLYLSMTPDQRATRPPKYRIRLKTLVKHQVQRRLSLAIPTIQ